MILSSSGIEVTEPEKGGYYALGTLAVWLEVLVQEGGLPGSTVGARWTIDGWITRQDAMGFRKGASAGGELWRVEVGRLVVIGWRDGSIGGPNGEQPSGNVWTLWGPDRARVRCLPLGSPVPAFEFALFMKSGDTMHWNSNEGRNFRLELSPFGGKLD